jgi:hypothetical protein
MLSSSFLSTETTMVLTKSELVTQLQHEVHILLHLASKIDRSRLDYRPAPTQRSTLELLQYLSFMGPEILKAIKGGKFDPPSWTVAQKAAAARDFDQTLAVIAAQAQGYADTLSAWSDADLRTEIEMFGRKASRGSMIVSIVLCGCAAYRTQLFLYLKACGRVELSTMNLWAGADAPA